MTKKIGLGGGDVWTRVDSIFYLLYYEKKTISIKFIQQKKLLRNISDEEDQICKKYNLEQANNIQMIKNIADIYKKTIDFNGIKEKIDILNFSYLTLLATRYQNSCQSYLQILNIYKNKNIKLSWKDEQKILTILRLVDQKSILNNNIINKENNYFQIKQVLEFEKQIKKINYKYFECLKQYQEVVKKLSLNFIDIDEAYLLMKFYREQRNILKDLIISQLKQNSQNEVLQNICCKFDQHLIHRKQLSLYTQNINEQQVIIQNQKQFYNKKSCLAFISLLDNQFGVIKNVNKGFLKTLGFQIKQQVVGKSISQIFPLNLIENKNETMISSIITEEFLYLYNDILDIPLFIARNNLGYSQPFQVKVQSQKINDEDFGLAIWANPIQDDNIYLVLDYNDPSSVKALSQIFKDKFINQKFDVQNLKNIRMENFIPIINYFVKKCDTENQNKRFETLLIRSQLRSESYDLRHPNFLNSLKYQEIYSIIVKFQIVKTKIASFVNMIIESYSQKQYFKEKVFLIQQYQKQIQEICGISLEFNPTNEENNDDKFFKPTKSQFYQDPILEDTNILTTLRQESDQNEFKTMIQNLINTVNYQTIQKYCEDSVLNDLQISKINGSFNDQQKYIEIEPTNEAINTQFSQAQYQIQNTNMSIKILEDASVDQMIQGLNSNEFSFENLQQNQNILVQQNLANQEDDTTIEKKSQTQFVQHKNQAQKNQEIQSVSSSSKSFEDKFQRENFKYINWVYMINVQFSYALSEKNNYLLNEYNLLQTPPSQLQEFTQLQINDQKSRINLSKQYLLYLYNNTNPQIQLFNIVLNQDILQKIFYSKVHSDKYQMHMLYAMLMQDYGIFYVASDLDPNGQIKQQNGENYGALNNQVQSIFSQINSKYLDQLNQIQSQNILQLYVTILVTFFCLISLIPSYILTKIQQQKILELFATLDREYLKDILMDLSYQIQCYKGNVGKKKFDNSNSSYSTLEEVQISKKNHSIPIYIEKKLNISRTSSLKYSLKFFIFGLIVVFLLICVYPTLNYILISKFINNSTIIFNFNSAICDTSFAIYNSLRNRYGLVTAFLLPQWQSLPISTFQNNLNQTADQIFSLPKLIKENLENVTNANLYNQQIFKDYLVNIYTANACDTMQNYTLYQNQDFQYTQCGSVSQGTLQKGLLNAIVFFINIYKDFLSFAFAENASDFKQGFNVYNQNIPAYDQFLLRIELQKAHESLMKFFQDQNLQLYNYYEQIIIISATIQICFLVLLFVISWYSYFKNVNRIIFSTKQLLDIFPSQTIIKNTYIMSFLRQNK
ncbi:transmembrane protein, putative (macronuclear) [Tetrahymena thermophila SB210]|uniref:Transmembrane protein, putative n=1 Tax=Tetrahymena thermophila (strain SB210) TaxID=312017 RepID=Q22QR3_TETTS|nr:transmembrane protein, putative [Tetrahymena thermophila SB210]EAR87609.2 transmembrane protein, putative [Tetrahymena thermophila SB210]|eukprot:XP_001007854.2 transmembrane protein, putative [Tetrahymena thermophila SB210]